MHTKLVIDAIVRQTTVLIAQVATSARMRAPLAHLANQTFLALTQELERQGLAQKVIADMFGLALRSYQQKVQRQCSGRPTVRSDIELELSVCWLDTVPADPFVSPPPQDYTCGTRSFVPGTDGGFWMPVVSP